MPDSWRLAVALCGFGLSWSLSRLVSVVLILVTQCMYLSILISTSTVFVLSMLQDCFSFSNNRYQNGKRETVKDVVQNRLAIRYVCLLCLLWFMHGYVYYGLAHGIDSLSSNLVSSKLFVISMDVLSKFFGFIICR